jgi:hypothetical protein
MIRTLTIVLVLLVLGIDVALLVAGDLLPRYIVVQETHHG